MAHNGEQHLHESQGIDSTNRLTYLLGVQLDSFAQLYSSKTDDELIALAADLDSIVDEARPVLADELRRRNLASFQPTSAAVEYQTATSQRIPVAKGFLTVGAFVSHLVAALFGTAMVESSIWAVLGRPRSLAGTEAKIWFTSLTIAALLGFFIGRYRPSKSALWVWVLPGTIFAFRVLLYGFGRTGALVEHFLAPNCLQSKTECQDFLVFTISAARTGAYSLGAWASLRFHDRATKTDVAAV